MLASAHLAMSRHFDMDELYQHLVASQGNKGKTKVRRHAAPMCSTAYALLQAYMYRAFEPTPIRRSTFFFVFKYYTVVGSGMAPTPWQQFDQRTPDKQQQGPHRHRRVQLHPRAVARGPARQGGPDPLQEEAAGASRLRLGCLRAVAPAKHPVLPRRPPLGAQRGRQQALLQRSLRLSRLAVGRVPRCREALHQAARAHCQADHASCQPPCPPHPPFLLPLSATDVV